MLWPCSPVLIAEACQTMAARADKFRAAHREWRGDCTGEAELYQDEDGWIWTHESDDCPGHANPPPKPTLIGWLVKVGLIPREVKA